MYKSVLQPIFAILALALFMLNCDGRTSTSKALKESVKQFNAENTIEFVSHYPETYTETKKDTLLSNGFRIQLKTFSNMHKSISKTMSSNGANYNIKYREFESSIILEYNNVIIFHNTIDKTFLNQSLPEDLDENLLLKSAWINEEASLFSDIVAIDLEYCKIDSDNCTSFNLRVDKNGNFELLPTTDYML